MPDAVPVIDAYSPRRTLSAVVGLCLAALLVTSCSADPERTEAADAPGPGESRVLQPGRPGEEARIVEHPEDVVPDDAWSHADIAFMQMMIPHHGQALTMSRLADERADDARVRTLAERIEAAQGPEIMLMAAWLEERGVEVPKADDDPAELDHSQHGHNAMAGMLTSRQMDRLRRSSGREFDRLFLRGMIGHHRGALTMVDGWAPEGEDVRVSELAADVAATQAAEILRMQDLLRSL